MGTITIKHVDVMHDGRKVGFILSKDGGRWWESWMRTSAVGYRRIGGSRVKTLAQRAVLDALMESTT